MHEPGPEPVAGPAPSVGAARLVPIGQASLPAQFPLVGDRIFIGRSSGCEVCLPRPGLSRAHAKIERRADGWYLVDLGAKNGTGLNGERVRAPVRLAHGDTLVFGKAQLRFVDPGAPPRERPEAPGNQRESATDEGIEILGETWADMETLADTDEISLDESMQALDLVESEVETPAVTPDEARGEDRAASAPSSPATRPSASADALARHAEFFVERPLQVEPLFQAAPLSAPSAPPPVPTHKPQVPVLVPQPPPSVAVEEAASGSKTALIIVGTALVVLVIVAALVVLLADPPPRPLETERKLETPARAPLAGDESVVRLSAPTSVALDVNAFRIRVQPLLEERCALCHEPSRGNAPALRVHHWRHPLDHDDAAANLSAWQSATSAEDPTKSALWKAFRGEDGLVAHARIKPFAAGDALLQRVARWMKGEAMHNLAPRAVIEGPREGSVRLRLSFSSAGSVDPDSQRVLLATWRLVAGPRDSALTRNGVEASDDPEAAAQAPAAAIVNGVPASFVVHEHDAVLTADMPGLYVLECRVFDFTDESIPVFHQVLISRPDSEAAAPEVLPPEADVSPSETPQISPPASETPDARGKRATEPPSDAPPGADTPAGPSEAAADTLKLVFPAPAPRLAGEIPLRITLSGAAPGAAVTLDWRLERKPGDSQAALVGDGERGAVLMTDRAGEYLVSVQARADGQESARLSAVVTVIEAPKPEFPPEFFTKRRWLRRAMGELLARTPLTAEYERFGAGGETGFFAELLASEEYARAFLDQSRQRLGLVGRFAPETDDLRQELTQGRISYPAAFAQLVHSRYFLDLHADADLLVTRVFEEVLVMAPKRSPAQFRSAKLMVADRSETFLGEKGQGVESFLTIALDSARYQEAFVERLYQTFLARKPSAAELKDSVARLSSDAKGYRGLVLSALVGDEYRKALDSPRGRGAEGFVRGLYVDLLDRAPTMREFESGMIILDSDNQSDRAYAELVASVLSHREIEWPSASASVDEQWIRPRVHRLLARDWSEEERQSWFAQGKVITARQVIASILGSAEYRRH